MRTIPKKVIFLEAIPILWWSQCVTTSLTYISRLEVARSVDRSQKRVCTGLKSTCKNLDLDENDVKTTINETSRI